MNGISKQKEVTPYNDIYDLTAYEHVSFGNTHTKSLYFSASRKMDPAIFWSTRTLDNNLRTCRSRGHNWDRVGIALLKEDYCDIKFDVSDSYRAAINGLNNCYIQNQMGEWMSDQRVWRLATSNHEVILQKIHHKACLKFYTVKELCLWNLWKWGEDDNKVTKEKQIARWCSYEEWGSRTKQNIIPSDWLSWLPR